MKPVEVGDVVEWVGTYKDGWATTRFGKIVALSHDRNGTGPAFLVHLEQQNFKDVWLSPDEVRIV